MIDHDDLPCDDQSFLVVRTVDRLPVQLVSDDDPERAGASDYFLSRALAPQGDSRDALAVRWITSSQLAAESWDSTATVFVGYLGSLADEAARRLRDHVQQGGTAVILCGEGAVQRNLLVLDQLSPDGWLPWRPGTRHNLARQHRSARLSSGKWQSALLRELDPPSQLALGEIQFGGYWDAAELRPGTEVLLAFDDGTPALGLCQRGWPPATCCCSSPSAGA